MRTTEHTVTLPIKDYEELIRIKELKDPRVVAGLKNDGSYMLWYSRDIGDEQILKLKTDLEHLSAINNALKLENEVLRGQKESELKEVLNDNASWFLRKCNEFIKKQ